MVLAGYHIVAIPCSSQWPPPPARRPAPRKWTRTHTARPAADQARVHADWGAEKRVHGHLRAAAGAHGDLQAIERKGVYLFSRHAIHPDSASPTPDRPAQSHFFLFKRAQPTAARQPQRAIWLTRSCFPAVALARLAVSRSPPLHLPASASPRPPPPPQEMSHKEMHFFDWQCLGTQPRHRFGAISQALLSSTPPYTRRVMCSLLSALCSGGRAYRMLGHAILCNPMQSYHGRQSLGVG